METVLFEVPRSMPMVRWGDESCVLIGGTSCYSFTLKSVQRSYIPKKLI